MSDTVFTQVGYTLGGLVNYIKMGEIDGCFSCPGEEVKVSRSISVNLEWFCEHGEKQHKTFYHLPCRVVLHEMDHLNNKLILDYE